MDQRSISHLLLLIIFALINIDGTFGSKNGWWSLFDSEGTVNRSWHHYKHSRTTDKPDQWTPMIEPQITTISSIIKWQTNLKENNNNNDNEKINYNNSNEKINNNNDNDNRKESSSQSIQNWIKDIDEPKEWNSEEHLELLGSTSSPVFIKKNHEEIINEKTSPYGHDKSISRISEIRWDDYEEFPTLDIKSRNDHQPFIQLKTPKKHNKKQNIDRFDLIEKNEPKKADIFVKTKPVKRKAKIWFEIPSKKILQPTTRPYELETTTLRNLPFLNEKKSTFTDQKALVIEEKKNNDEIKDPMKAQDKNNIRFVWGRRKGYNEKEELIETTTISSLTPFRFELHKNTTKDLSDKLVSKTNNSNKSKKNNNKKRKKRKKTKTETAKVTSVTTNPSVEVFDEDWITTERIQIDNIKRTGFTWKSSVDNAVADVKPIVKNEKVIDKLEKKTGPFNFDWNHEKEVSRTFESMKDKLIQAQPPSSSFEKKIQIVNQPDNNENNDNLLDGKLENKIKVKSENLIDGNEDLDTRLEDSITGIPDQDYATYVTVPKTSFKCSDHSFPGYYGDTETKCQVFHMCQADGRQDSFICPIGTVFNQMLLVCDWWNNFNCEDTPTFYNLNTNLYSISDKDCLRINNDDNTNDNSNSLVKKSLHENEESSVYFNDEYSDTMKSRTNRQIEQLRNDNDDVDYWMDDRTTTTKSI